jgi:hypothetical protein
MAALAWKLKRRNNLTPSAQTPWYLKKTDRDDQRDPTMPADTDVVRPYGDAEFCNGLIRTPER